MLEGKCASGWELTSGRLGGRLGAAVYYSEASLALLEPLFYLEERRYGGA